jgi:hypothetical protein
MMPRNSRLSLKRLGPRCPSAPGSNESCIVADIFPVVFSPSTSTTENALLENALKTHLNLTVKFKVEKQDESVECGISARYVSGPIDMVIFNFTDKKLHNNKDELAFVYDSVLLQIL